MRDFSADRCRVCGAGPASGTFTIAPEKRFPIAFVYPRTSSGRFGFCNICLEEERFTGLSLEDIQAVRWLFSEIEEDDGKTDW